MQVKVVLKGDRPDWGPGPFTMEIMFSGSLLEPGAAVPDDAGEVRFAWFGGGMPEEHGTLLPGDERDPSVIKWSSGSESRTSLFVERDGAPVAIREGERVVLNEGRLGWGATEYRVLTVRAL